MKQIIDMILNIWNVENENKNDTLMDNIDE